MVEGGRKREKKVFNFGDFKVVSRVVTISIKFIALKKML